MSSNLSIGDMIRFSWAKSREILFPLQFKRWFRVLVIVWLAGAGIQGFSANFKIPAKPAKLVSVPREFKMPTLPPAMLPQQMEKAPQTASGEAPSTAETPGLSTQEVSRDALQKEEEPLSISQDADRIAKLRASMDRPKRKTGPVMFTLLIAGIIVLAVGSVALLLFFLWISSRFNFVFLDTLVTRKPAIKGPFKKHKDSGNSYFVWTLIFMGIIFGVLLLTGLVLLLFVGIMKWNLAIGIPLWALGGFLVLVVLLGMIFIGTIMRDFVVPVMYLEKIPAMSALRKFLRAGSFTFGKAFQYLLVVFGLWILALIVQSVVGILVAIGGLIAGGIVAIPGIILFKALPFLKFPLIIFGGFIAVALFLAVIVVIGMVMLPAVIFFRVFALAYLTRLYPECDLMEFAGKKS